MKLYNHVSFVAIFLILVGLGCAGSTNPVGNPPNPVSGNGAQTEISGGRVLWGLWHCFMEPGGSQIEVVPLRTATFTANVNSLLESKPGNLLIQDLDTTNFFTEGRIGCTVTLRHPFPGLFQYDGFDVLGVFMHNGSTPIGYDSLVYSDGSGENEAVLENPDGCTRWYNFTEFEGGSVPLFDYTPGKLGALPSPSDMLNPYKVFADGLGAEDNYYGWITTPGNADNRGIFTAGQANSRRYHLRFPMMGGEPVLEFQYAAVASWEPGDPTLTGSPDTYDPGDFPTNANIEEPFLLTVSTIASDLYYQDPEHFGGNFRADIEVFDWQGGTVGHTGVPNEVNRVIINGDFLPGGTHEFSQSELASMAVAGTENSSVFQIDLAGCTPKVSGDRKLWVIVEAAGQNGGTYDQGFPSTVYPDPARRAAFLTKSVAVGNLAPPPVFTFHAELDAGFIFDTIYRDYAPCVLTTPANAVYMMYVKEYYIPSNCTCTYAYTTNSGQDWIQPNWGAMGGFVDGDDSAPGYDNNGDAYYCTHSHIVYMWSTVVRFAPKDPNSGLYCTQSIYGRAFVFTYDGYPVTFGDYGDSVNYKKGTDQNLPTSQGQWTGWNSTPQYQAVPYPARLSKTNNCLRKPDHSIYFVYFSPEATGKWIRLAYNTDGSALDWNIGNVVYDGTADGYDRARDPGLHLDAGNIFRSAFVLHTTSPSEMESIAYTKSTDGLTWDAPLIAYSIPGTNLLNDVTINLVTVNGHEIVTITYLEGDKVFLTFSWDEGETWQTPVLLSTGSDSKPDTCLTPDGYLHTVWEHNKGTDLSIEYIRAHFVED